MTAEIKPVFETEKDSYLSVFTNMDKKQKGYLDRLDIKKVIFQQYGKVDDHYLYELYETIDPENLNKITFNEFIDPFLELKSRIDANN